MSYFLIYDTVFVYFVSVILRIKILILKNLLQFCIFLLDRDILEEQRTTRYVWLPVPTQMPNSISLYCTFVVNFPLAEDIINYSLQNL